jgi:hypothetical protein
MESVALCLLIDDIVENDPPTPEMAEPMAKALKLLLQDEEEDTE